MVNKENEESGFDGGKLNESEVKPDISITNKPSTDPIDKAIEESDEKLESGSEIKNPSSEKESSNKDSEKTVDESDPPQQITTSEKTQKTSGKSDIRIGNVINTDATDNADSEIVEKKIEGIISDPVIEPEPKVEIETSQEEVKSDADMQKLDDTLEGSDDNLEEQPNTQPEETEDKLMKKVPLRVRTKQKTLLPNLKNLVK